MRLTLNAHGYLQTPLTRDGRVVRFKAHTLVLTAFDRPRREGEVCRHLNGDRTDNRLENLAWGTVRENYADMVAHGTVVTPRGERNHSAKLRASDIPEIRRELSRGVSQAELGRRYGVSRPAIQAVASGWTWRHIADEPELNRPGPKPANMEGIVNG